jgi:hypothetical protein
MSRHCPPAKIRFPVPAATKAAITQKTVSQEQDPPFLSPLLQSLSLGLLHPPVFEQARPLEIF